MSIGVWAAPGGHLRARWADYSEEIGVVMTLIATGAGHVRHFARKLRRVLRSAVDLTEKPLSRRKRPPHYSGGMSDRHEPSGFRLRGPE